MPITCEKWNHQARLASRQEINISCGLCRRFPCMDGFVPCVAAKSLMPPSWRRQLLQCLLSCIVRGSACFMNAWTKEQKSTKLNFPSKKFTWYLRSWERRVRLQNVPQWCCVSQDSILWQLLLELFPKAATPVTIYHTVMDAAHSTMNNRGLKFSPPLRTNAY